MSTLRSIVRRGAAQAVARATAIAASARDEWPYLVCAVIALAAIWGHRYPVGIDIAQHANLFRISADMTVGPVEYRGLYRIEPFTPYLLAYALAYPFALLFGSIAATKCLLTMAMLATPIMMRRWLREIGANPDLGLLGFLLAFGFPYHWGFISQTLAIPLALAYLTAFERQGVRPGWRAIVKTLLLAVILFFCHGITWGLLTLIVGVRLLLRRRPLEAWRAGLHALPIGITALLWWRLRQQHTGKTIGHDWVNADRLTTLFSGAFSAYASYFWAGVSLIGIVLLLAAMRPRLVLRPRRVVPLGVSLALFLSLPETLADTWMIASRFCVFVHAFAPALLEPKRTGRPARVWPRLLLVWVALLLVTLNVRLRAYNDEIAGLWELTNHMEHGFDVRTMLPATVHDSETMGQAQFGQAAAWITAEFGGILENDSTDYYQMPIRRGSLPFPSFYRYIIAKGKVDEATAKVTEKWSSARLIHEASSWLLFEDPPAGNRDYTVVRSLQGWGQLRRDQSVSEAPLTIGGTRFDHGLGTHAESFIRIRIDKPGRALVGGCGIDDRGGSGGKARFGIRDDAGEILFESGEVREGEPVRRFTVLLEGRRELILDVRKVETIDRAHADWVDLQVSAP